MQAQLRTTDQGRTDSHEFFHLFLFHPTLQLSLFLCIESCKKDNVSKKFNTVIEVSEVCHFVTHPSILLFQSVLFCNCDITKLLTPVLLLFGQWSLCSRFIKPQIIFNMEAKIWTTAAWIYLLPCAELLSISHSSLFRDNSSKGSIKTRSLGCRSVLFYLGALSYSSLPAL